MIRPLRRRHRWLTAAVALVVLPLFLAALRSRPAEPVVPAVPGEAVGVGNEPWIDLVSHPRLRVQVRGPGVVVDSAAAVDLPDLLLYASPLDAASGALPVEARLLGAVRGRGLQELPAHPDPGERFLVLYSLGHGRVVASVELAGEDG